MKKEQEKKPKFPRISRFIPEEFKKLMALIAAVFVFFVVVLLLFGIVFYGIRIYKEYRNLRQIEAQRQNLQSQINFWQSVANKYSGYKDAYFKIAILEYQLGNYPEAKIFNQKALLLDPGYQDANMLGKILNNR